MLVLHSEHLRSSLRQSCTRPYRTHVESLLCAGNSDVTPDWSDSWTPRSVSRKDLQFKSSILITFQWFHLNSLLFSQIQNQSLCFPGSKSVLAWLGFLPPIPPESEALWRYLWRRAPSGAGEMEGTHDLFVKTSLPGSRTTGGNLFCPHESLRFWSGKKLLGRPT